MATELFYRGGISAHRLVAAARFFKEHPEGEALTGDWADPRWKAKDFWRWFGKCLAEKINAKDPRYSKGRKAEYEYQMSLGRMRAYVGNRVVIDWIDRALGPRVKAAFAHRMRHADCAGGHVCT